MEKKMAIMNFGKYQIVAEVYQADEDFPKEMTIYLYDPENDIIVQDICLVRAHYDLNDDGVKISDKLMDCLVWSNATIEDYTHQFVIDAIQEE